MLTVGKPPPPDEATGTGNSPPARKSALSPEDATRLGSANRRTTDCSSSALSTASRLPDLELMIEVRIVANGLVPVKPVTASPIGLPVGVTLLGLLVELYVPTLPTLFPPRQKES